MGADTIDELMFFRIVISTSPITSSPSRYTTFNAASHNPKFVRSNAANTHRLMNNPHTSAYKVRPYMATMFRKIRRLGDIKMDFA